MVIRDRLTKIQLLIVLASACMLLFGCGSDEESIVEPDTAVVPAVAPDVSTDEPDPVPPTESPKDVPKEVVEEVEVEEVEDVSATIRGLVLDQVTKTPLIDVRVQLTDEAGVVLETPTATSGVFEFEGVTTDQQLTIAIDSDEYEKQEFTVDPILVGETVKLEVELIPLEPAQLPEGDGLAVGVKAPDFSLPDKDGKKIALADYAAKKKVVLIFYRGSW